MIFVYIKRNNGSTGWQEDWMLDCALEALERGDYIMVDDNGKEKE